MGMGPQTRRSPAAGDSRPRPRNFPGPARGGFPAALGPAALLPPESAHAHPEATRLEPSRYQPWKAGVNQLRQRVFLWLGQQFWLRSKPPGE
jgi:hypothetical protein